MTAAPARPPAGRYGPERPDRTRLVRLGLVLTGVAGVALAAWIGLAMGSAPVHWQDVGFRVVGDGEVAVTFDVERTDPGRAASCRVEALNEAFAQVGVRTVEVPPAEHTRVRLTATVATSERAVTGTVTSCRLHDG